MRKIHKGQVEILNKAILSNGYRIAREKYYFKGAILTLYDKSIMTQTKINTRIQILISVIDTDASSDLYRNLGITIRNVDSNDSPEISAEVDRIEELLYNTLVGIAGEGNVVRGKRRY